MQEANIVIAAPLSAVPKAQYCPAIKTFCAQRIELMRSERGSADIFWFAAPIGALVGAVVGAAAGVRAAYREARWGRSERRTYQWMSPGEAFRTALTGNPRALLSAIARGAISGAALGVGGAVAAHTYPEAPLKTGIVVGAAALALPTGAYLYQRGEEGLDVATLAFGAGLAGAFAGALIGAVEQDKRPVQPPVAVVRTAQRVGNIGGVLAIGAGEDQIFLDLPKDLIDPERVDLVMTPIPPGSENAPEGRQCVAVHVRDRVEPAAKQSPGSEYVDYNAGSYIGESKQAPFPIKELPADRSCLPTAEAGTSVMSIELGR